MACGQPATTHIRRNFSWYPPWIAITILAGLLIYVILALVLTKRMTVEVPVCDRHRGYWWKRGLALFGSFLVFVLVCIGGGIALDAALSNDAGGFICGLVALSVVVWLVLALVFQSTMIRPKEITDESITLANVDDEFVGALRNLRNPNFEDADYRPRRNRRESDDEYE